MQTGSHPSTPKRAILCLPRRSAQLLPTDASGNRWHLNVVLKKEEFPGRERLTVSSVISGYLQWQAEESLKESGWEQNTSKRGQLVSTGGSRWYHLFVWIYPILSAIPNLLSFPEGMVKQRWTFQKRNLGKAEDTYDKFKRTIHSFFKGRNMYKGLETKI